MEQSNKTHYAQLRERDRTSAQSKVLAREAEAIRERRKAMFPDKADGDPEAPIEDAVGMALSGGGVRSASFNLGMLQAFTQSGVMRWVDYLSTVSGGGFIGTYFSTLLCHSRTGKLNPDLEFVPKKDGGAPAPVDHFIRGGSYLKDSSMMLDRFVMGFILNVIVWGSLLVCITSGLALMWRTLDSPALNVWVRDHAGIVGSYFRDWSRPFLISTVYLLVWMVTWGVTFVRGFGPRYDAPRTSSKKLLVMSLLTAVVGVAVLLATEDISLKGLEFFLGAHPNRPLNYEPRAQGQNIVGTLLLIALALNVLPYLNPITIFRSEMRPPGKVQNTVLKFSGAALLLLLPFSLIYLFSLEGISRYHLERSPDFVSVDIRRPFQFLHYLREEAHAKGATATALSKVGQISFIPPPENPSAVPPSKPSLNAPAVVRFGAPEIARIVYTKTLARPTPPKPSDPPTPPTNDSKSCCLLTQVIKEDRKLETRNLLRGYPDIFGDVKDKLLTEAMLTQAPIKYKGLKELREEHKTLANLLEAARKLENVEARKENIEKGIAQLKWTALIEQCTSDLGVLSESTGDPKLDAFIEFGLALDEQYSKPINGGKPLDGTHIPHSTVDFSRKVTGAYIATVLNRNFLGGREAIKTLLAKSQAERAGPLFDRADAFFAHARTLREGDIFVDSFWPNAVVAEGVLVENDRQRINRWILEALYGGFYIEERTKAGLALCWSDDQYCRAIIFGISLAVFFLFGSVVDVNATSLHGFYRRKLEDAYVVQGTGGDKLSDLNTTAQGGPYHFICATLNFFDDWPWKTTEYSSAYTFYFSRLFCGSQALPGDPAETDKYCGGQLDVATAAAISGAAFSPAILRNPLLFCMTMLLNLRLGQWLPNPSKSIGTTHSRKVTMISILRDFLRTLLAEKEAKQPQNWNYCFITDGGHNDNLALAPLLFRNPRLVFISDATQDGDFHFPDFFKAYRRYRVRGGMHFRRLNCWDDLLEVDSNCIDFEPLKPRQITRYVENVQADGSRRAPGGRDVKHNVQRERATPDCSPKHFVLSKFTYPKDASGQQRRPTILVYIKSTMTGDEPQDLMQYQVNHPHFPHDPTTDQFFTENQVESYRQLGEHVGQEVCETVLKGKRLLGLDRPGDGLWGEPCAFDVEDLTLLLLLGYFDGELPRDPATLLQLLDRCVSFDLLVDLLLALAPADLQESETEQLQAALRSKACALEARMLNELLDRLRQVAEYATKDLGIGIPNAAKQLAFLEQVLFILKEALQERSEGELDGAAFHAMSRDAALAIEKIYGDAVRVTYSHLVVLPDETLDFLLRVIQNAEGRACLDAFAKLIWSRLDTDRADQFVSAMCYRLSQLDSAQVERTLGYLEKGVIKEGRNKVERANSDSISGDWRLIDYMLHRLAEDTSFPSGVNEYARELLQTELENAQQLVDGGDVPERDEALQSIIREFLQMLDGDAERTQESVIIYSLGVAERRLSKLVGSALRVAFVWRGVDATEGPVTDTEPLRYTFFRPQKVLATAKQTLARRVFQRNVPDYINDVAQAPDFDELPGTRGTVAAIPCFVDDAPDTPEGVLHVSCSKVIDDPQLIKALKKELGQLARLCAYASDIGKRRQLDSTQT